MKRIIFVDDEENVLHALKRMLHSMHRDWDMVFCESAEDALKIMAQGAVFDVVVADFRMPGMDGAEFLGKVKELYPQTVRFCLSGQPDSKTMLKVAGLTHQFINKPCDPQKLQNLITRAMALREQVCGERLRKRLLEIGTLPSLPVLQREVMNEIESSDPSVSKIGEIIKKDVGMSAKVLQIVNSAFTGLRQDVSDATQAAGLLGIENLRGIVLMIGAFSLEENNELPKCLSLNSLWSHSLTVGEYSRKIALSKTVDKKLADDSFTAGLLHDVGELVIALKMPDEYSKIVKKAKQKKMSLFDAEKEVFGSTHAAVGGYLLKLWGLPEQVVEAIALHSTPSASKTEGFSALTAVHLAEYFASERTSADGETETGNIDMAYLDKLMLSERLPEMRELCIHSED